jgi:septin family protein
MEIYPIQTNAPDEIAIWKKRAKPTVFSKVPFTGLVYGSSGTGKSTMVANVFLRDFNRLNDVFQPKNIYVFAKNGQSDVNFRALMMHFKKLDPTWDNFSAELDIAMIRGLIDKNRDLFDRIPSERLKIKNQVLLLIDD